MATGESGGATDELAKIKFEIQLTKKLNKQKTTDKTLTV